MKSQTPSRSNVYRPLYNPDRALCRTPETLNPQSWKTKFNPVEPYWTPRPRDANSQVETLINKHRFCIKAIRIPIVEWFINQGPNLGAKIITDTILGFLLDLPGP